MSTNTYTTLAGLPAASSNTGNVALVTSNGVQYISDGEKWKSQGEFTTGTIESLQLDDLSFNGSFTNFALKVGGSNVFPQNSTDVIIIVNGATLKPGRDFTFIKSSTATNISFTNSDNSPKAYPSGTIFYGLVFSRLPLDSNNALQKSGGTMVGDITFSSNQSFPSSGISNATTSQSGIVSLSSSTGSTSESVAATSKAVKDAKDAADAAATTASSAATTANAALPKAGGTMTGDITFNSTQQFDGRDVSADGTKLDGIATSANNYSISSDLLDEDNMASNSATKAASQQSVKAYVDANTGTTNLSYTASSRELASSTGTNVNLPEATTSAAGLQSSADKTKLDGIETSATADQTGAEIKSAYEGESDTNAFTDADHTKLDGIATGAEVNVNADWNSTSGDSQILNKPTLVSALNDLSDVSAASPSANQIIKWNGSAWALAADGGGSGGGGVSQNLLVTLTESIDGSRTDFTMSTTPATAQNLMVSINGVIQKPNAGTTISNSSEGYCISGSTLKFATAPANGSTVFVVAQTAGSGGSVDLSFNDSTKVKLGTGNDLQIYHDGSHSYIKDTGTGRLILQSSQLCLQSTTGENFFIGNPDAAVELYYNNSKKAETTANGLFVTGSLWADGLYLDDNEKIHLGTSGADLDIYHDGANSLITNATGVFVVKGDDYRIKSYSTDEEMIHAHVNAGVELYYDNSLKLDVKSWGVEINGDLGLDDNRKLALGNGPDLQIYHDGTNSVINNGTGGLYIKNDGVIEFQKASSGETKAKFISDGAVELYYDNSKKFETENLGVKVYGHIFADDNNQLRLGNSGDLQIYHDGSNSLIVNKTGNLGIKAQEYEEGIIIRRNASVDLYYDNSKKLETFSAGVLVGATSQNGHGTTIGQDGVQLTVNFSTTDIRWMQIWESDHGTDEAKAGVQSDGKIMARTTSIQSFSSERRTKKNIVELDKNKAWNTIRDTPFYTFNYKPEPDGSELHHAPIVDELPADMVVPTQASDEVGVINTYNAERLLFRSFSALQQALKKIETLETKVAALEGA